MQLTGRILWRNNSAQLAQSLATDSMSLNCKYSMLVVVEQQSLLSELFEQGFDLSILKLNDLLLPLVHEAAETGQQDGLLRSPQSFSGIATAVHVAAYAPGAPLDIAERRKLERQRCSYDQAAVDRAHTLLWKTAQQPRIDGFTYTGDALLG